jgi:hypothetical protein
MINKHNVHTAALLIKQYSKLKAHKKVKIIYSQIKSIKKITLYAKLQF